MPRVTLSRFLFALMMGFAINTANAEIYKWVDEHGEVHFGDRESTEHAAEKVDVKINTIDSVTVYKSPAPAPVAAKKDVVLYTAEWCGVCKKARAYMKENKIPFKEYDVEKSDKGRRDFKKMKGDGVPIILVDDQRMDGFAPKSFDSLYGRAN